MRPFSKKEIALLQNFAAQAVIAMENARLLTETREALDQQTATAEVLGVINSSPGDLAPVFDTILDKAHAICGATQGGLAIFGDGQFRVIAAHGVPDFAEYSIRPPSNGNAPFEQIARGAQLVHLADVQTIDAYRERPEFKSLMDLRGIRTLLVMPLRKEGILLGALSAFRQEVKPFTEKQIALLQNFAAQAVVAMENARLLTETREALEQQTATAEVLQVINSSPGDLTPVFEAMLERAICFCQADEGILTNRNGGEFEVLAVRSSRPAMSVSVGMRSAIDRGTVGGRVMLEGRTVHIRDVNADPDYRNPRLAKGQIGTLLGVPLLRKGVVVGSFNLARERIEAFTEKQIAVVESFAAQAVIAMEKRAAPDRDARGAGAADRDR